MQTLFLKYFPLFIVFHFVFCVFTFMSLFSYVDGVSLTASRWAGIQPLFIKSVILAVVNQAVPVFIYFKLSQQK